MTDVIGDSPTRRGSIRKNSAAHIMLLVFKFYGKPVTLRDVREIASSSKITPNNQRRYVDYLLKRGFICEIGGESRAETQFMITKSGVRQVYDIADRKK